MKAKNALNLSGGNLTATDVHVGDRVTVRMSKGSRRTAYYPPGCVGANLAMRNYVKYLVGRYHEYREADERFGRTDRFHYAVLFKNVETKFKAPIYFIPEGRFEELVDYLHNRIDGTILGKVNHKRGIPNFESFDDYVLTHMSAAASS